MRTLMILVLALVPAVAHADILLLDVNQQDGERRAVQKLAAEFGEDANIVVGAKTKDFLVLLENEFARAERGETDVTTIVFSGHSGTGREFYSEDHDRQILIGDLEKLAKKYPKAFSQVRHVLLMGCMAGAKDDIGSWAGLFPNVTVAAGFNGVGPSNGAANRFLKQVLRAVDKAESDAGGANQLAALLANDQNAIDAWAAALGGLDAVQRTSFGLDICGSYHTNVKTTENTPRRLERLLNEAFFACRDAERSCTDPSRKQAALRELYLDTEAHIRPTHPNTAWLDSQQKKVHKLLHYDDFEKQWLAKNGARLDDASRKLAGFPDAATFGASSRAEQLDAIRSLDRNADPALATLADDMRREVVELRETP